MTAILKTYPTLYTLTSTQSVRYWKISVVQEGNGKVTIIRDYGHLGGKAIILNKVVHEAKSHKTIVDQAVFEADGLWTEMKTKKGYVEDQSQLSSTMAQLTSAPKPGATKTTGARSMTGAQATTGEKKVLTIKRIAPGSAADSAPKTAIVDYRSFKFLPMLANKFTERQSYVTWPCVIQPKLDGVRYSARKLSDGSVLIKTRNDMECPFFEEIRKSIATLDLKPEVILDGEFYSTKIPFKTLNGYCNRKKMDGKTGFSKIPREHLESIAYHVFDCYFVNDPQKPFSERYQYLVDLLGKVTNPYLHLVRAEQLDKAEEVKSMHDQYVAQGYEGLMVRNSKGVYRLKDRSNDLLKYKEFNDEEYLITGAECSTSGKEEGCIIWTLALPGDSKTTFTCRPRDTHESRRADWLTYCKDPSKYIDKKYTVRFQEKYDNGVPRFPVGVSMCYDH